MSDTPETNNKEYILEKFSLWKLWNLNKYATSIFNIEVSKSCTKGVTRTQNITFLKVKLKNHYRKKLIYT